LIISTPYIYNLKQNTLITIPINNSQIIMANIIITIVNRYS